VVAVKIGWLEDRYNRTVGGAEISQRAFLDAAPDWAEVVYMPARLRPTFEVDAYIVHNSVGYGREWIEYLERAPVIRHIHDLWPWGDCVIRRWLLDNSRALFFNSPKQLELFGFSYSVPRVEFIPLPVNIQHYKDIARFSLKRSGTCWISRIDPGKGIYYVLDWAVKNNERVDFYGFGEPAMVSMIQSPGRYMGPLDHSDVPRTLARYERFICMPTSPDLYGRVMIEAWAAGCDLVTRGDLRAFFDYFSPEKCQDAGRIFWETVEAVLAES